MNRTMRRSGAITAICALSVTGLTATASATTGAAAPVSASAVSGAGGLSAEQWDEVARAASAAGDQTASRSAADMAAKARGNVASPQVFPMLAKNAVKAALKYGRGALPKQIRPYADKLYNLIDSIENTGEIAIAGTLSAGGLPPDQARFAAQWIVTFL
ncbi:hypothetical protein [Pseudokineococcus sp. 1T1Z-3]|uniref:hypothetical protein n=1 Tax=Pseudokineococcus sp. 1T1Z-3 TaxID=3132745 RepID=UPI0030B7898B